MNAVVLNNHPRKHLEERFDLLAADAKEYAVFLFGLDGADRVRGTRIQCARLHGAAHTLPHLARLVESP
jgi:hypothetical protein